MEKQSVVPAGLRSYHDEWRMSPGLASSGLLREKYVVEPYPAWPAIEVSGFVTPGAIVEIRVVAATQP